MDKQNNERKTSKFTLVFLLTGFAATVWFLIRVIPKPSRAGYPCQKAAFPVASAFVIWLVASVGSIKILRKVISSLHKASYIRAVLYSGLSLLLVGVAVLIGMQSQSIAGILNTQEVPLVKTFHENNIDRLPSVVAMVKSPKANATELSYQDIEVMVREAVSLSGGLQGIITDGQTVMLKPNLVNDKDFSTTVNGVITDYRVIKAVAALVRELNPTGKILLAEGSADKIPTLTNMDKYLYKTISTVDEFIGFETSSGDYGDFNSDKLISVNLPDSISLYPDEKKPNNSRALYYNKKYFEADVLISIPVLKNHQNAGITGGVKNVAIGATPATIYANKDFSRPYLRSQVIDHNNGFLELFIHDYYAGRPVDFVVIDGLQGVSSGPGGAKLEDNQHNMRLIIAGKDAISTDAIAGLVMGHDPQIAPYLVHLHNHRFGIVDPALIEVKGVQVYDVREDFGFDNNYVTQTKFDKFLSKDYDMMCSIHNRNFYASVYSPTDLARMQIWVDGQKINKYVVGGFSNINLDLDEIVVSEGKVEVLFEDRYLNVLNKEFLAQISTDISENEINPEIRLYPNPVSYLIHLEWFSPSLQDYHLQIYDMNGSVVFSERVDDIIGNYKHTVSAENLEKGRYILYVTGGEGKIKSSSFIKN